MGQETSIQPPVKGCRIQRKRLIGVALLITILVFLTYFGLWQHAANQNATDPYMLKGESNIPSSIAEKSNQFVISRVGQDFFDKYIKIDYNHCMYILPSEYTLEHPESAAEFLQRPYYLMAYSFKMPEKPFVDELMQFCVDANGSVILESEPTGILQIVSNPTEGYFPIDEARAVKIAKDAGLEDGIAAWRTSFHWYAGDLKTYVWTVQNTLPNSPEQDCLAWGRCIVIDANSGQVLQISRWDVVS